MVVILPGTPIAAILLTTGATKVPVGRALRDRALGDARDLGRENPVLRSSEIAEVDPARQRILGEAAPT